MVAAIARVEYSIIYIDVTSDYVSIDELLDSPSRCGVVSERVSLYTVYSILRMMRLTNGGSRRRHREKEEWRRVV